MRPFQRRLQRHPFQQQKRGSVRIVNAGWTVIELLVVIAVVAVILSIALPAMSKARLAARRTKSEANAKTLVFAILNFADTHKEQFPIGEVGKVYPASNRSTLIGLASWYENMLAWPGVIYDTLPFDENVDVYLSPLGTYPIGKAYAWPTSYFYSSTFTGDPKIWTPNFVGDATLLRAARLSEVASPSGKALIWDEELSLMRKVGATNIFGPQVTNVPVAVGFVDASVRSKRLDESNEPVWGTIEGGPAIPPIRLCNTANGVHGTDY